MQSPHYLRERDLVGTRAVSPEKAAANSARPGRIRRPRAAAPGILPISAATLWRWVRAGKFPAPVALCDGRVTAWRAADVRAWMESQGEALQ